MNTSNGPSFMNLLFPSYHRLMTTHAALTTNDGSGPRIINTYDAIILREGETVLSLEPADPMDRVAEANEILIHAWMMPQAPLPDDEPMVVYWALVVSRPTTLAIHGVPTYTMETIVAPIYSRDTTKLDDRCLHPSLTDALFSLMSLYYATKEDNNGEGRLHKSYMELAYDATNRLTKVLGTVILDRLAAAYLESDY